MGTYTEKQLKNMNIRQNAVTGQYYYSDNGDTYRGALDGSLEFITSNFAKKAQRAVGEILTNTNNIDLTYDDSASTITSDLTDEGTAGTYGDATHVPQITLDDKGRVQEVVLIPISGSIGTELIIDYVATANITIYDVVTSLGTVGNSATIAQRNKIIGVATATVGTGFPGQVVGFGQITNAGWAWTVGAKIFLNGTTLSTTAPSSGFIQIIGTATASDTIDVKIAQSILL